jgi:hypothetical protein
MQPAIAPQDMVVGSGWGLGPAAELAVVLREGVASVRSRYGPMLASLASYVQARFSSDLFRQPAQLGFEFLEAWFAFQSALRIIGSMQDRRNYARHLFK